MSISVSQVSQGYQGFSQTSDRSFDVKDSREVQELLVRACTMKAADVDGLWSTRKTGTSNVAFKEAAHKYRAKLNAMVGKPADALVYNWTEPYERTTRGLKRVKISPAGFYKRLKRVVMEDEGRCYLPGEERPSEEPPPTATAAPTASARAGTAPSTSPGTTEQPFVPAANVTGDPAVCRQFVAGAPVVLTSMDQQAVALVVAYKNFKAGKSGQKGPILDYIKWFDNTGAPAAKKVASQLRVCGRDDLAGQVTNKLDDLTVGVNNVRKEINYCAALKEQSNAIVGEANKLGKQIVRDAERKKWTLLKKGIAAANQLVIPTLRAKRNEYKEKGCGEDKAKMIKKLQDAIDLLKKRIAKARDIRKKWLEEQARKQEVVTPPPQEPEFEPEPEPTPAVVEEEEEAKPGFMLFQNPWPWILGGAALVFGVVAVSKAAKEKGEERALPATAGYGRYRRY